MADDSVTASTFIDAAAEAVFGVLADPFQHASLDGTGWVTDVVDGGPLVETGQLFRMAMYHQGHRGVLVKQNPHDAVATLPLR